MTRARRDGVCLLLLGCAAFLLVGAAVARISPAAGEDFRLFYNGNRCLLEHVDPYQEATYERVYLADGGPQYDPSQRDAFMESMRYQYLPTSFIAAPLALLPFETAQTIWLALIAGSFILASFLMWDLGARYAPVLSGSLIGILLAGSQMLLVHANPAGIVISLCVVAVWCFLENRFVPMGISCLAVSLLLKPHDVALIWLYFLFAGSVYRKRAMQTLALAAILTLPLVLWTTHVAPNWLNELHTNLTILTTHGHANDPGPASMSIHGTGMIPSLPSVLSTFRDDARFYSPLSYVICGVLLLVWSLTTLRLRPTPAATWLALAAIAPLSLLPFYHRLYDAKLLLLAVPACAMLRAEGGRLSRVAIAVTATGILLIGDLQWVIFSNHLKDLPPPTSGLSPHWFTALQVFPVPLILLTIAVFYLWVYVRRAADPHPTSHARPASTTEAHATPPTATHTQNLSQAIRL